MDSERRKILLPGERYELPTEGPMAQTPSYPGDCTRCGSRVRHVATNPKRDVFEFRCPKCRHGNIVVVPQVVQLRSTPLALVKGDE